MDECVRLMQETFEALANGEALNQPRRRLFVPTGAVLHSMAGAVGPYFGTKWYSVHLRHGAHFFFMLFDAATAQPLALMEANYLGQIRTGAASGYATHLLSRPDSAAIGVVGSGFQARSQVEAILEVRSIEKLFVYSRNEARREAFAEDVSRTFGLPATAMGSAEEAVSRADIVVTATHSKEPVIESEWIQDGTHINAMGSNNAQRRELPADLISRARWIAVDSIEQAKIEAGDLLLAWQEQDWQTERLKELKDVAGLNRDENDITIFKSIGLGVEDVAAGAFVYEKAREAKMGKEV